MKFLLIFFVLIGCGNPNPQEKLIAKDYNVLKSFSYERCGVVSFRNNQYHLETNSETLKLSINDEVKNELEKVDLPKSKCFYSNQDVVQASELNKFNAEYIN